MALTLGRSQCPSQMRRLPALLAALLLPSAQPLLLGAAVSTGTLLVSQTPSNAQSAEAVARVAQAITVRIEGATQGSGVLVKREGNRYTVLTAWHVVSGQRPGEELDIYTPDGLRHQVEQGSIKRLGQVDMAVLNFSSRDFYDLARIGDVKSVSSGSAIWVSGFPLPTSAVPVRVMRLKEGRLEAYAQVFIPNGYQLLYSNPTLPGMSGGAVLNDQGQLIGIHGQGETDSKMSEQEGVAVKTGTNQAVPIAYYSSFVASVKMDDYSEEPTAREPPATRNTEKCANFAEADKRLVEGNAKYRARDYEGAILEYNKIIACNPLNAFALNNRGAARLALGDAQGAALDFTSAIRVDPKYYAAIENLSNLKPQARD